MLTLFTYIAGFAICSSLIVFSGTRLSQYGDIIAELTGMGKAWFGLILMAAVTSLPELFTGISSIVFIDSPDIAVGDIMGSCAFNLLILAVLDYFVPGRPISSIVTKSHVLAGFFGIFLITLSVISIIFGSKFPVIDMFSSYSILLIIIYIVAIRIIFKNEQKLQASGPGYHEQTNGQNYKNTSLKFAVTRYVIFALLVIAGAIALPYFADHLAQVAGLSKSFVGTLLVAATTSLPEPLSPVINTVTSVGATCLMISLNSTMGIESPSNSLVCKSLFNI